MSSKIEWLNGGDTWNPIIARVRPDAAEIARAKGYASLVQIAEKQAGKRGHHCEHAHAGCANCYAEAMNGRCLTAWGTGLPYDRRSRDLLTFEIHEETLVQPLKWRKPRSIFPCSMTDLFGDWVPDEFIERIFAVMAACYRHRFIVLTKRTERMVQWVPRQIGMAASLLEDHIEELIGEYGALANWPLPNVILGTSASDQATYDAAAPHMRALAAAGWHTVWSFEPLLGPVDARTTFPRRVPLDQIPGGALNDGCTEMWERGTSWVIVGGESGHGARPCNIEWIRSIVCQCKAAGVPCFVKQIGANMDGDWAQFPNWDWDANGYPVRDRKGADMAEWPQDLRVRELPEVLR